MNVRRDLEVYFPLTISDFYLGLLLWFGFTFHPYELTNKHRFILASLCIFVVSSFISILFSEVYHVSWFSSLMLGKFVIIFLLPIIVSIPDKKKVLQSVFLVLVAFTLFESTWGGAQFIFHGYLGRYIESFNTMYSYGKVAWENPGLLRISGTFVDPDLFGTFMFMQFVMFYYMWLKKLSESKFETILFGISAIASAMSIFITGNRILYMLLFVSFASLAAATKQISTIVSHAKKPLGLVCIAAAIAIISPYVFVRLQNLPGVFSEFGSGTFRIQMLFYSARLGLNNWVGVGLGMSPYHFATEFSGENMIFGPDIPHNIFSQIFVESGLLGLLSFIIFVYFSFRDAIIRGANTANFHLYLAAGAYLVSACFYPLFIPLVELPAFFFFYLGLAVFTKL
jgi:hypothetical protein